MSEPRAHNAKDAAPSRGRRVAALVRHGHFPRPDNVASGHQLLPLSEEGREQARRAADDILAFARDANLELDPKIEASGLLRASETASVLANALGAPTKTAFEVEDRDELLERGLGSCANLRFEEIERLLALDPRLAPLPAGWRRIPDFRLPVPHAESLLQAGERTAARIDASLREIDPTRPDRLRLFVAHSGCLRHAAVARKLLTEREVVGLKMDFAQVIFVEVLADGSWRHIGGEWKQRKVERVDGDTSAANLEPSL